jgi:vitamin B12 transporter
MTGVLRVKYLFLLSCSIAVSSPACAQDAALDDAERSDRDITVLASGFAEPRDETGAAISVIDRKRLDQLQSTTINDALRTLPGVSVALRGPVGTQTSVFIRGANSSQTLVLIDGVRVNDQSSPNAQYDFGPLLSGNAARIEVLRGPNSIVWGSQAIGGVVNIEMERSEGPFHVDSALEYGYADTLSGHANLSGTAGILETSFGGSYYRTDGISALTGAPGAELDGSRIYALNGRLKINIAPSFSLDLRGYFNDSRVSYDSPFSGGADSLAVANNDQFVAYVGANLDLADGRFRSRVAYTRTDIDRLGTDPVVFSFNNYVAQGTTDRFEYRGTFDLADFVTIVAGAEYEKIRSSVSFEGFAPDLAEDSVTSGYAQITLRPLTGLSVTGGVRHDSYNDYGDHTTLGGNLAYTPNGGQTVLRATYGEGFRAPTLTEGQPPYGNPALKPETARNLDAGIEQALLDGRVRLGATYFRRRTTDQIVYSFTTGQSENIERVDTDGLELTLEAVPSRTLHIEANYTLTDAINRSGGDAGNRLALRPKHSGTVSADWESPIGLKLGGTLTIAGDSFDDAANVVRIDGYAVFDLRASYALTEKIELYGRVENLFDENYTVVSGYGTFGRSAYAGVRARF